MVASLRRALLGLPIVAVIVFALFAILPFLATCGGHDEAVTAVLLRCPRARELIGDDAHPARLGYACGSTETSGNTGTASWSMPFTGSRGRGTVSFDAQKRGGDWIVFGAQLEVDDETIDLVRCGGETPSTSALAQTNADAVTAGFEGQVIRSNHPTIVVGSICSGRLERERGSPNAHVTVRCKGGATESTDEVTLYDGSGSFSLDVRDASRRDDDRPEYDDSKTTDQDGTAGCRLSGNGNVAGTLTLWDTSYELVVAL